MPVKMFRVHQGGHGQAQGNAASGSIGAGLRVSPVAPLLAAKAALAGEQAVYC